MCAEAEKIVSCSRKNVSLNPNSIFLKEKNGKSIQGKMDFIGNLMDSGILKDSFSTQFVYQIKL